MNQKKVVVVRGVIMDIQIAEMMKYQPRYIFAPSKSDIRKYEKANRTK